MFLKICTLDVFICSEFQGVVFEFWELVTGASCEEAGRQKGAQMNIYAFEREDPGGALIQLKLTLP